MYINLGQLNLQYTTRVDDWMIFSEIVDSGMSYEKPILVRNVDELEIWFGKEFSDYEYLKELLQSGVTLYLYKPISTTKTGGVMEGWIDYSSYEKPAININVSENDIQWLTKFHNNPGEYMIKIQGRSGWYTWNGEDWVPVTSHLEEAYPGIELIPSMIPEYTWFLGEGSDRRLLPILGYSTPWIWYNGEMINTAELPQNINNQSSSLLNRDTLSVTIPDSSVPYCYPTYSSDGLIYGNKIESGRVLSAEEIERIEAGYSSYVFRVSFSSESLSSGFIVFPDPNRPGVCKLGYVKDPDKNSVPSKYYISGEETKISTSRDLLDFFRTIGYSVGREDNEWIISSSVPVWVLEYYTIPEVTITPVIKDSREIVASIPEREIGMEVTGKTIGKASDLDDSCLIWVEVEKTIDSMYRISCGRYEYSETYEGSLRPGNGEERLDHKITRESKLIRINFLNPNKELRTGRWILRGGTKEKVTREMYWEGLDAVYNDQSEPVYPDYHMVPRLSDYIDTKQVPKDYNYYLEYKKFLEYSKEFGTQFLFTNTKPFDSIIEYPDKSFLQGSGKERTVYRYEGDGWCWEGGSWRQLTIAELEIAEASGDHIYNYLGDSDNRLLWFYQGMELYGYPRPGWYVYIRGLLLDEFSATPKDIQYPLITTNPYSPEDIETSLESRKCNYMVCNNQMYYYKKYFNGKDYVTTGWMRFVIGKVGRELEKHKWDYLGQRMMGRVRDKITGLLNRIGEIGIIDRISLRSFIPSLENNSLDLEIDIYVNDLVDNNIKLDITINYNNYGNSS